MVIRWFQFDDLDNLPPDNCKPLNHKGKSRVNQMTKSAQRQIGF